MEREIRRVIEDQWTVRNLEIESRRCTSDRFAGTEYTIRGDDIPVEPIIELVSETDGVAIESILHIDEGDPRLSIFVADLPKLTLGGAFV